MSCLEGGYNTEVFVTEIKLSIESASSNKLFRWLPSAVFSAQKLYWARLWTSSEFPSLQSPFKHSELLIQLFLTVSVGCQRALWGGLLLWKQSRECWRTMTRGGALTSWRSGWTANMPDILLYQYIYPQRSSFLLGKVVQIAPPIQKRLRKVIRSPNCLIDLLKTYFKKILCLRHGEGESRW